jgi:hypothetical protein
MFHALTLMKTILTILASVAIAASAHAQSLIPMDTVQRKTAAVDRSVQGTAYYVGLAVQAAARQHAEVWGSSDEELAGLLTAFGPEVTAGLIEQHRQGATALNAIAEMLGISARAPVQPSREFSFVDGVAVVVPLPEPETTPEQ